MTEARGGLIPKNEVMPAASNDDEDATKNLDPNPDSVPDIAASQQEVEKPVEYDKPMETRAQAVAEVFQSHADELSDKLFDLKIDKASFKEQVEAFNNLKELTDTMNDVDIQDVFGNQLQQERYQGLVKNEYHSFIELKKGLEKQIKNLSYQYESMGLDTDNITEEESEALTEKIENAAKNRETTEREKNVEVGERVKSLTEETQELHAKWLLDNAEVLSSDNEPTRKIGREKMQDTERAMEGISLERGVLLTLEAGDDSAAQAIRERTQSLGGVEQYNNIQLELRPITIESPVEEMNKSLEVVEKNVDEMRHQVDLLQERVKKIDEMIAREIPGVDQDKKNELLQDIRKDITNKMTTVDTRLWMANSMLEDLRQDKIAREAFDRMENSGEYVLEELGISVDTQAISESLVQIEQQAKSRVAKLREQLPGSKFENQEEMQAREGIRVEEQNLEQEEKETIKRLQEIKTSLADQEAIIDKHRSQGQDIFLGKKGGAFGWFSDMANNYRLQKILTAEGSSQTAKELLAARQQLEEEQSELVANLAESKVKRNVFRLRRIQIEKQLDNRAKPPRPQAAAA